MALKMHREVGSKISTLQGLQNVIESMAVSPRNSIPSRTLPNPHLASILISIPVPLDPDIPPVWIMELKWWGQNGDLWERGLCWRKLETLLVFHMSELPRQILHNERATVSSAQNFRGSEGSAVKILTDSCLVLRWETLRFSLPLTKMITKVRR